MADKVQIRAQSAKISKNRVAEGKSNQISLFDRTDNKGTLGFSRLVSRKIPNPKRSHNIFFGLEITNISLVKPKKASGKNKKEKDRITEEELLYKPIEYQDYLMSNYQKVILDESFRMLGNSNRVFHTGRIRTGSTLKKYRKRLMES